ncbi:MAG: GGDEF domain-containing protein [Gammaproteobacteria bacterium]|nr:GGDEF domain-containing protein [Gammaproteobacteria bacterium]MDH5629382.1 GGDEF domain-containing protein [Gammaproteobacteria bacterium]
MNFKFYLLGILLGAASVSLFSVFQKLIMHVEIVAKGFIAPIFLGGLVGYIITSYILKNKKLVLELLDKNIELERLVENRTKELVEKNKLLEKLSITDGLTQIHNRRYFDERIQEECARLLRKQSELSIILCDVDNFKDFNDCYGHQAGDDCLIKVVKALKSCVSRNDDFVARYGGEEFVIVLPNTNVEQAKAIAEKARLKIVKMKIENKNASPNFITMSFGVGSVSSDNFDINDKYSKLVEIADKNLYLSKSNGKNQVTQ